MAKQNEQEPVENVEIYERIAQYLAEEKLITPAERLRFLDMLQEGMHS